MRQLVRIDTDAIKIQAQTYQFFEIFFLLILAIVTELDKLVNDIIY